MNSPGEIGRKASARIMIVGEAPGDMEDQLDRPFSGPVHDKIENALRQARPGGISRDEVYFTNTIKCRPVDINPETGNLVNRAPYPEEVEACKPLLEKEISAVKPDAIIAMGGIAIKALTGEGLVKNAVSAGVLMYQDKKGKNTFFVPAYHPSEAAYLLRAHDIEGMMRCSNSGTTRSSARPRSLDWKAKREDRPAR
jgi:DNA polymerase